MRFSAEVLRFDEFFEFANATFVLFLLKNAFYIVNSVNFKKFVKSLSALISAKSLGPTLCLPIVRQNMTMAANDSSEFKKTKFIQIQIFSKVKRYRFV